MAFRKLQHQFDMPEHVRVTFRPTAAQRRARYRETNKMRLPWEENLRREDERMRRARLSKVTLAEITKVLEEKWEKISQEEVQSTVEILLAEGFLREDSFRAFSLPDLPETPLIPSRYNSQNPHAGICPRCGEYSKNKNRHANSGHGTECKLNRVRQVMES